jgi:hypothetical protein
MSHVKPLPTVWFLAFKTASENTSVVDENESDCKFSGIATGGIIEYWI